MDEGFTWKLERTHDHLMTLNDDVTAWREAGPIELGLRHEPGGVVLVYVEKLTPPTPRMGVLVGDVLHALRSSLDMAVWMMVSDEVGEPHHESQISFPVFDDEAKFRNHAKHTMSQLPEGVAKAIRAVQPFETHTDPRESPLCQLAALDNLNKHRTPLLAATVVEIHGLEFPGVLNVFGGSLMSPLVPLGTAVGLVDSSRVRICPHWKDVDHAEGIPGGVPERRCRSGPQA